MPQLLLLLKIVGRQLQLHPGRAVITLVGVIASASAVVWVVSGYDGLVAQFDENAERYLGRYDLLLVPTAPPGTVSYISEEVIDALRADEEILEANPLSQSRVTVSRAKKDAASSKRPATALELLLDGQPPVNGAPPIEPILVATAARSPPYDLLSGRWLDEGPHADVAAVISSGVAEKLGLSVGDEVLITTMANQRKLPICGVVAQAPDAPVLRQQPRSAGPTPPPGERRVAGEGSHAEEPVDGRKGIGGRDQRARVDGAADHGADAATTRLGIPVAFVQGVATAAVYVRPEVAEDINGFPTRPTVVQIALPDAINVQQFVARWQPRLTAATPPVQVIDFRRVREGLESSRNVASRRAQAYAVTGMAALAALFIIFSLLSMEVGERARELALLRAVACSRWQVATLVIGESLLLAVIGWLGGLVTGLLLLGIGKVWMPQLSPPERRWGGHASD